MQVLLVLDTDGHFSVQRLTVFFLWQLLCGSFQDCLVPTETHLLSFSVLFLSLHLRAGGPSHFFLWEFAGLKQGPYRELRASMLMALPVSPSTRNSIVENQIASLVLPLGWPNVACKTRHEFGDPFTGIPVHVKRSIHSPVRLILLLCTLFFRGYGLDTDPFDTGVVH